MFGQTAPKPTTPVDEAFGTAERLSWVRKLPDSGSIVRNASVGRLSCVVLASAKSVDPRLVFRLLKHTRQESPGGSRLPGVQTVPGVQTARNEHRKELAAPPQAQRLLAVLFFTGTNISVRDESWLSELLAAYSKCAYPHTR